MLTPFQNKAKERSVVILLAINQFSRDQPHSLYVGKAQSAFIHKQRIVGPFLQYRIWEQEDMPCRNLWTWWKMTFFTRLLTSYWSPGQSRAKPARPRSQQHFRSILEKKKKKKEKNPPLLPSFSYTTDCIQYLELDHQYSIVLPKHFCREENSFEILLHPPFNNGEDAGVSIKIFQLLLLCSSRNGCRIYYFGYQG